MKKLFLIGGICCSLGAVILAITLIYLNSGKNVIKLEGKNDMYIEKRYECTSDIDSLLVAERSERLVIRSGNVSKATIVYYVPASDDNVNISETNGKLTFEREDTKTFFTISLGSVQDTSTEIVLPSDFKGTIDATDKSGGMNVNTLEKLDGLKLHNSSGSLMLENVSVLSDVDLYCSSGSMFIEKLDVAGSLTLEEHSGRTSANNIVVTGDFSAKTSSGSSEYSNTSVAGTFSVNGSSGSIQCSQLEGNDISVENSSGSIKLEDVFAKDSVYAKNSSGSISCDNLDAGKTITLKNGSGSIKGTIAGKESDYSILSNSKSGSSNLEDSRNGEKELNVSTGSGSIKIEFED